MPRFKGANGCYNKHDARELGLAPAVIWNDIIDRAEQFDAQKIWYDQKMASERLGIPQQTISRSIQTLQEAGRIKVEGGYRPNSSVRTTWITVVDEYLDDNLITQNELPKETQNGLSILKETKEKILTKELPVRVEKWDFDSKGNWKRKRTVYTTSDEADKIEEAGKDEYVTFGYWPSPRLVGIQDKMKTMSEKKTKLKTEYPEEETKVSDKLKTFVKITDM